MENSTNQNLTNQNSQNQNSSNSINQPKGKLGSLRSNKTVTNSYSEPTKDVILVNPTSESTSNSSNSNLTKIIEDQNLKIEKLHSEMKNLESSLFRSTNLIVGLMLMSIGNKSVESDLKKLYEVITDNSKKLVEIETNLAKLMSM